MSSKSLSNIIFVSFVIILFSGIVFFRYQIYELIFTVRSKLFIDKEYNSTEIDLIKENIDLKSKLAKLSYLEKDNAILRSAIETKEKTQSNLLEVNIIGFDNSLNRNLVIFNKGKKDNITENQSIIYKGYFVGKIIEVSEEISKAEFINSNQSNIGVRIQNELRSEGILKSNYGIELFIDLIPKTEKITIGDFVYTSGIGDVKEGLLIGNIKSIEEGDLFYKVYIDYPFDLNRLYKVYILQ